MRVHHIVKVMIEKTGYRELQSIPVLILQRVGWNGEHIFTSTLDEMGNRKVESPYCLVVPFRRDSNEIENMKSLNLEEISIFEKFNYEKIPEKLD